MSEADFIIRFAKKHTALINPYGQQNHQIRYSNISTILNIDIIPLLRLSNHYVYNFNNRINIVMNDT